MADSQYPRIPVRLRDWQELNRRVSLFSENSLTRLEIVEDRQTTSFQGTYNQVTDVTAPGGVALDPATNYQPGDFYTLSATGTFSTSIPELTGLSGGAGDQIISDGTVWLFLNRSADFLSSVIDDTAAGVITFSQPPIGTLAATSGNQLIRKTESDSGDAVVQGNLDAHIGTTNIHFADAPADDEMYGRRNNGWEVLRLETALLYGAPSSFTLGTGITTLTSWANGVTNSTDFTVSAAAGTITINTVGIYSFSAGLIGIQGNDTKEEDIYLWSRSSVSGDEEIWSYHVATDKGANYRPLAREFIVNVSAVPDVFSLGMQATAGLGTFTFINAQLGATKIEI